MKEIYLDIGNTNKNKRVIDIGCDMIYNVFNKLLFNNRNIEYYQVDTIDKINDLSCDFYIKTDFTKILVKNSKYLKYFDYVLSFGVLGWYKNFSYNYSILYLKTAYEILKNDGIFFLKIDGSINNYNFSFNDIKNLFIILKEINCAGYTFLKLKKKT